LESLLNPAGITFGVLRNRLITRVKSRVNNGEFSERGLARLLGISQSQTHNVLKGARELRVNLADRMLNKLNISAIDLLTENELDWALRQKMTVWDTELGDIDGGEMTVGNIDLEGFFAVKIPPAREESRSRARNKGAV
jgi:hypothetical protein